MALGFSGSAIAEPSSEQAVEFAPGVISTKAHFEINVILNEAQNHVVFSRCANDFSTCTMMESSLVAGEWSTPIALPISGQYLDADPYYNADYSALYFISKRPTTENGEETKTVNLWRTQLINGQ